MAMFGALPAMSAAAPGAMQQMAGMMPKGAGMFGAGKPKMDWAGLGQALIGGYLAGRGVPGGNAILGMMNQRQQAQQEQAQYHQRREDGFQDYVRREAWDIANKPPAGNDTIADYNFWQSVLSPEQFQQYVSNKVNPPRFQFIDGLGVVQVNGGGAAAPAQPVGSLTPIADGGPTPQASGSFPGPY